MEKDFSSNWTAIDDWRTSNPRYESILLASNKNWTLLCQKFQNIRLTHIAQNNAKFHEKNSLGLQGFPQLTVIQSSVSNSFVRTAN